MCAKSRESLGIQLVPDIRGWLSLLWFVTFTTEIKHISGILWSKIMIDHSTDASFKYKNILFYGFTRNYCSLRP